MNKLLKELRTVPTASIADALDSLGTTGIMNYAIKIRTSNTRIVGFAVTVKDVLTTEKNSPLKALEAIDAARKGDILVRAIEGAKDEIAGNIALFGGIMALGSSLKGLSGAVLDGGTRDVMECEALNFPVFSRSVIPTTSVGRTQVLEVNVPLKCGGVRVNPGDVIVGDADGVVVIPREKLETVTMAAKEIDDRERKVSDELKKGSPLPASVKKFSRI